MREGERDPERITALIMERHNPPILKALELGRGKRSGSLRVG